MKGNNNGDFFFKLKIQKHLVTVKRQGFNAFLT